MTANIDTTEFVQQLLLRGNAPYGCHRKGRVIEMFHAWWWNQDTGNPNPVEYVRWMNQERAEVSASTLRSRKVAGLDWFRFKKVPEIDMWVLKEYRLPPIPDAVPHPIPGGMDAVRELVNEAQGNIRNVIALQGFAGLRVTEARTLKREDIDVHNRDIVVKGKGEKIRRVPISSELQGWLDLMPAEGRLAVLADSGARHGIRRVAERAGIVGFDGNAVSSHDLRATWATAVYEKTYDIWLVSRLLGHASVRTTQAYLGLGEDKLRMAVEL
jgi:integrase